MVRYLVRCANTFFRTCRRNGVFIFEPDRSVALFHGLEMNDPWKKPIGFEKWYCKEAFAQLAKMAYDNNWKLFRIRPKFHLCFHIVRLLRSGADASLNPCSPFHALGSLDMFTRQLNHPKVTPAGLMRTTLGGAAVYLERCTRFCAQHAQFRRVCACI